MARFKTDVARKDGFQIKSQRIQTDLYWLSKLWRIKIEMGTRFRNNCKKNQKDSRFCSKCIKEDFSVSWLGMCFWICSWSSKYLFIQIYPKYFDFILALDVPAYTEISGGLKGKLFVVAYQSFLIWSFLIGGFIGEALTRSASKLFKHYLSYLDQIKADRNYPYYYYWKNQLLSRFGK